MIFEECTSNSKLLSENCLFMFATAATNNGVTCFLFRKKLRSEKLFSHVKFLSWQSGGLHFLSALQLCIFKQSLSCS